MLNPSLLEKVLHRGLAGGADFAEIFLEESASSGWELLDRKSTTSVPVLSGA